MTQTSLYRHSLSVLSTKHMSTYITLHILWRPYLHSSNISWPVSIWNHNNTSVLTCFNLNHWYKWPWPYSFIYEGRGTTQKCVHFKNRTNWNHVNQGLAVILFSFAHCILQTVKQCTEVSRYLWTQGMQLLTTNKKLALSAL